MKDLSVKAKRFLETDQAGEYIEKIADFYEKGYTPHKLQRLLEFLERCKNSSDNK